MMRKRNMYKVLRKNTGGSDKDGQPGGKRDDGAVRAKKLAVHGQKVCCIRDEDLVLWLHDVFVKDF